VDDLAIGDAYPRPTQGDFGERVPVENTLSQRYQVKEIVLDMYFPANPDEIAREDAPKTSAAAREFAASWPATRIRPCEISA
jgi:hypothetical protein